MNPTIFILAAYAIAGILIAYLCASTWLRARHVARQLAQRDDA